MAALIPATVYFLALFAIGFALGTVRVMAVAPRLGSLAATALEVPLMLMAAYFICRWVTRHWHVPRRLALRRVMVAWFLILLFSFESLFGTLLFGRTLLEQWTTLTSTAGLLGLSAQIIAAVFPVLMRKR